MYGLLIENVIEFIKFKYGEDTWLRIRDKSKIHEYTFVTHKMYSEKVIPRLAKAVQDITGDNEDDFMRETGYDFVLFLGKYGYDKMLRVLGRSMRDFLNGLDNLHEYLRFSYPKMKPPSFFVTDETKDGLTLHYRTKRKGYVHYVQGQLMRVGKLFYNLDVQVQLLADEGEDGDVHSVVFRLIFDNREFQDAQNDSEQVKRTLSFKESNLPCDVLFDLFPFHVKFDSTMIINGIGSGLKAVMPDLCGKKLTEAFELKRPFVPFTWHSIRHHENCVFDVQSTDLVIRNLETFIGVSEGNSPGHSNTLGAVNGHDAQLKSARNSVVFTAGDENDNADDTLDNHDDSEGEILEDVFQPRRIRLKGQMRYINSWGSYMFLATPTLPNLDAMFETGLFINDLSMHDSSRDLVLAGTQQSAELKIALDQEVQKSKQLEQSMRQLDKEMKRTDSLLYQMIPRQVAEKLRRGEPATSTCEVFRDVSILFSDVVGFTSICSRITPMAVVSMLNGMYTLFDNLSEQYDVYKVETIGDAYMVVGGAPVKTKLHAVRVVEMGLAMAEAIGELKDPSTGDAMAIRVGIHSGVVVAGVVGLKMPRYCLFGDTVNTASRMESTGEAMKIQVSEITKQYLDHYEGYQLVERGAIDVKGKGSMKTYWLKGKHPDAPDHLALHEVESSDISEALSRCDSSESNLTKRGSGMRVDTRRGSLISSVYTPVSFEELSRASTPAPPENEGRRSSLASCPMSALLSNDAFSINSRDDVRSPTPPHKNPQQKGVLFFGQRDYDHAQMQSFMDPAHAHGKMDGAPSAHQHQHHHHHHHSQAKKKQSPPSRSHPNDIQNNLDSNGSTPRLNQISSHLSPVPEKPQEKENIRPQTPRIETVDSSTNTISEHVPHSSACTIL